MTPDTVRTFAGLTIDDSKTVKTGLFMGLYGPGGAGKTTTLADIVRDPDSSPALLIDTEGGSSSVTHLRKFGLDIISPITWSDLEKILKALQREGHGYKTVIADHITEMTQMCLLRVAPSGQPEIQEWGKILVMMMGFVRDLRNLTVTQEINILLNVWEEEVVKQGEATKYKVNLFNKWAAAFPGMVTMLGRLTPYSDRPPYTRLLSFVPDVLRTDSKFRVNPEEIAATVPLEFYLKRGEVIDDGPFFMVDFVNMYRKGIKFPVEKYAKPTRQNSAS